MDQFKKYLREHRSELDVETPPSFEVISGRSDTPLHSVRIIRWIAAASVVLIMSSLTYWWLRAPKQGTNAGIVNVGANPGQKPADSNQAAVERTAIPGNGEPEKTKSEVSSRSSEQRSQNTVMNPKKQVIATRRSARKNKNESSPLESMETSYATVINYQLKRLERTPIYGENADYFHVFKKQWYDLEKDDEKIRHQLSMYGLSDVIVDQLIQLYQNKIALLKQLQTEIEKMNLRARNHPDFQDQTPTYLKM